MEQMLRMRFECRRQELGRLLSDAEDLKTRIGQNEVSLPELTLLHMKLKAALEAYEKELLRSGDLHNQEEQQDHFKRQMAAEEMLIELDMIKTLNAKQSESEQRKSTKLPKLHLSKFEGDVQKWPEFWARFESSIHNQSIAKADKLSYLFSLIEGRALEALRGIDITNENYDLAVETLKERFGDKDLVIDAHYNALNNLEKAKDSTCRLTLDTVNKHLRILKTLGEDTEGNVFRNIIYNKFPASIQYELNLLVPKEKNLKRMLESLETIVRAKERSGETSSYSMEAPTASTTEVLHTRSFSRKPPKRKFQDNFQGGHQKGNSRNWSKKSRPSCIFCERDHYSDQCKEYVTTQTRIKRLVSKRLCFKCFQASHTAKSCLKKQICFHCKKDHNSALCAKKFGVGRNSKEDKTAGHEKELNKPGNNPMIIKKIPGTTVLQANTTLYLQTATAHLRQDNKLVPLRLILDCGSHRSYITQNLVNQLNIIPDRQDQLVIYTFGSNVPKVSTSPSAEVMLVTKRGIERQLRVNIVPHIADKVNISYVEPDEDIDIPADDDSLGEKIDLLIGNDYYFSFMKGQSIEMQENLHLINTELGWIISGQSVEGNDNEADLSVITYCQCHGSDCPYFTEPDLPLRNIDMRFLWSLESIGIVDSPKATREEEAVKYFNDTVTFDKGRYEVKWPWIEYPPILPTNFGLAFGRLRSLLNRIDAATLQDYEDTLAEQLKAGVIEVVDPQTIPIYQVNPPVHYLPHHMVRQEGKRGRLVYDASAKVKDERSLNECMYRGPSMLEDLTALLLQFRTGKIGMTADVEKAFLQIGLQPEDRDVTRFLWIKDVEKELAEDNLLHLRFCRVPFGIISSPFLLTATIRHHLSSTNVTLLKKIADRCYVDNLVTEAKTLEEASNIYLETRKAFEQLSMNIRDWTSNDKQFMQDIPNEYRAKNREDAKVLGLIWDLQDDTLRLKVPNYKRDGIVSTPTKKDVLRTLARVYDPCGYASPIVLSAKLLFQDTCERKLKWNTALPSDMLQSWENVINTLESAKDIRIPRYIGQHSLEEDTVYELHCFTDASMNAYAAVVYIVLKGKENQYTSFIMSKSRITPLEDKDVLKIPRLELLGVLIGSRLLKYVEENLHIPINKKYLWTDSMIVLAWLKTNKLLPPFVARRINEIKSRKDVEFLYVPTEQNPADVATRPESMETKAHLWFNGPDFLCKEDSAWPAQEYNTQQILVSAGEVLDHVDGPEMTSKGYEIEDLEEIIISQESDDFQQSNELRVLQQEHFPEEMSGKTTTLVRNLGLYVDSNGILRCKGRMANTDWSYDKKNPILIPKECEFTKKLIMETHMKNYHVGVSHTLSLIREKFWIPQGRAQVKKVLKKCPQCIKHGGGPYKLPNTPALPAERVNLTTPFAFTGMDYFGPVFVQTNLGKQKRWIALFTCLAIRAIHLEVVNDLTAEQCLLGLKRFIAVRGKPNLIVSDNASQFKLVSEILTDPQCTRDRLRWKFIPQLAPWHGGVYERLIALVKNCLKRTLEKHLLQDGQLLTVIKEVEAVVNTRPLTAVGSEIEHILRPADFLSLGSCLEVNPIEEIISEGTLTKKELLRGWKRGQIILEEFKKMFHQLYLPSLRERYITTPRQPRITSDKIPQVGDIVQIKDSQKNRNLWKVGKVSTLIKGQDGECRVAKVKVGDHEFTRSIGHLYPLEGDLTSHRSPFDIVEQPIPIEVHQEDTERLELEIPFVPETETEMIEIEVPIIPLSDVSIEEPELENSSEPLVTKESSQFEDSEQEPFQVPVEVPTVSRVRRETAIRAREKIAEWTRHLLAIL